MSNAVPPRRVPQAYATPGPARSTVVLVMSILGLLYGIAGMAINGLMIAGVVLALQSAQGPLLASGYVEIAFIALFFVVAAGLVYASVGGLRNTASAPGQLRLWAVVYLVLILGYTGKTLIFDQPRTQPQQSQRTRGSSANASGYATGYMVGVVLGRLVYIAMPIAMLALVRERAYTPVQRYPLGRR